MGPGLCFGTQAPLFLSVHWTAIPTFLQTTQTSQAQRGLQMEGEKSGLESERPGTTIASYVV